MGTIKAKYITRKVVEDKSQEKLKEIQEEIKTILKPVNLFISLIQLFMWLTIWATSYNLIFNLAEFIVVGSTDLWDIRTAIIKLGIYGGITFIVYICAISWRQELKTAFKEIFSAKHFISYYLWFALVGFFGWALNDLITLWIGGLLGPDFMEIYFLVYFFAIIIAFLFILMLLFLLIAITRIKQKVLVKKTER